MPDAVIYFVIIGPKHFLSLGGLRGSAFERGRGAEGAGDAEPDLGAERERPPHRLQAPHREGRTMYSGMRLQRH